MTDQQRYEAYLDDFDPTPQYYGDDYGTPMSFEDFLDWEEEQSTLVDTP